MKFFLLMTVTATLFVGGCSSNPKANFNFETRRVTILTNPDGATVTQINPFCYPSTSLGLSPVKDRSIMIVSEVTKVKNMSYSGVKNLMEQVGNVVVKIDKEGYEPYRGTLKTDPKETLVHEIELHPKGADSK